MKRLREYRMAWKLICRIVYWSDSIPFDQTSGWLMTQINTHPFPVTEDEARFLQSFRASKQ